MRAPRAYGYGWILLVVALCGPGSSHAGEEDPRPAGDPFRAAIEQALASGRPDAALHVVETFRAPRLHKRLAHWKALQAVSIPALRLQAEADARSALRRADAAHEVALRGGNRRQVRETRVRRQAALAAYREAVLRGRATAEAKARVRRPDPVSAPALRAALDASQACVHYVVHEQRAWALVTTHASTRVADLGGTAGLHEALGHVALADRRPQWQAAVDLARRLLVEPLKLPDSIRHVWIVPDGRLHAAPLALLFGRRDVVRIPSASAWMVLRAVAQVPKGRILGLGDPDYRRRLRYVRLPDTRAEVDAVADVRLVAGEAAELTLIRVLVQEPRWRAVHLACHATVDERDGEYSALVLAPDEARDGLLHAFEVPQIALPCDLATLSTARSLRGSTDPVEGLEGLAPAFLAGGARAVLGSLWNVDDEATSALMRRFYELWHPDQGPGLVAPEALRLAREHVRLQPRWAHPFYWAGWELYGAP